MARHGFEEFGPEEFGPEGLSDRSSAPHNSPKRHRADVVAKIICLRQNYHFEPLKISMYLQRYHDTRSASPRVSRALDQLEMDRLPASQRHKR